MMTDIIFNLGKDGTLYKLNELILQNRYGVHETEE